MVLSGTSSTVDKSTKMMGGVVEKGTSLDLLAGAPPSTSDTSEFVGQQTSMPETFADLLRIHGVDATLWDELNCPLADCVSPLKTPIPATRHCDEPNLGVCSCVPFLEEEPTVATMEARLADMIPRAKEVPNSAGMRRKQKMASSSPRTIAGTVKRNVWKQVKAQKTVVNDASCITAVQWHRHSLSVISRNAFHCRFLADTLATCNSNHSNA